MYTKEQIIEAAEEVDERWGTAFAPQCRARIDISYPAIDSRAGLVPPDEVATVLGRRGLERDRYVLFLSRLSAEKGADDLIEGFGRAQVSECVPLVIAGNGPALADLRASAAASPVADRIMVLDDVGDAEKWSLLAGSSAFVLPSKPMPHFVETFGIVLAESMLAGGGPVITTTTGGIPEAVGDVATFVPVDEPDAIAVAIDEVVLELGADERARLAAGASPTPCSSTGSTCSTRWSSRRCWPAPA